MCVYTYIYTYMCMHGGMYVVMSLCVLFPPSTVLMRHHVQQRKTEVAQDGLVETREEVAVEHGIRAEKEATSSHRGFVEIISCIRDGENHIVFGLAI